MSQRQDWDPARYARNARFVSDLGAPALAWLDPRPGEHILDLGCGDGTLTAQIAQSGAQVIGVDASPAMVAAARVAGLSVRLLDGKDLDYLAEFDAVFSNAALHWMTDAEAVLRGVKAALKPGGRLVAEFGGGDNVAQVVAAITSVLARHGLSAAERNPWYFPGDLEYRDLLERLGFVVQRISLHPRPTVLPGDLMEWLQLFASPFLADLAEAARNARLREVRDLLAPTLCDNSGRWTVDYVRLRLHACRPA